MAKPNHIQENSTINLNRVKSFLRIDNDAYDEALKLILKGVKAQADTYCNSDFYEFDGDIPADVELWILQACQLIYDRPNNTVTRQDVFEDGTTYFDFNLDQFLLLLSSHRKEPGFF